MTTIYAIDTAFTNVIQAKKMKSKTFLIAISILLVTMIAIITFNTIRNSTSTLTLSPVSPSSTRQVTPVTVKFWEWFGGPWVEFFNEEARLFNKKYSWIKVEISHYSNQKAYLELLALALESGNAPDIFHRRHTFKQVFDNKWSQPLDSWITPEWLAKFPDGSFVETKNVWNGKIYSFPVTAYLTANKLLFINEDLFREAGLVDQVGNIITPRTWSDMRLIAKQITAAGKGNYYGVGIGIKDPRHISYWFELANLGGAPGTFEIDYRIGRYSFSTDPTFAKIINLLLGMKNDGSVYPNEGALDDGNLYSFFALGKFAMFLSGSWSISNLKRDFPNFQNYRVISLPIPDEGRRGGLPYVPGNGQFYMSAQTQHPNEAWLWLDWISSRDFHKRMVTNGLDYSVYHDLNIQQNIKEPKKLQAYEALTRYLVLAPSPITRNPQTIFINPKPVVPDLGDVLIGIYTGQIKDWQHALKELDRHKQDAFEDAIKEAQANGAKVSIEDFVFPDWDPVRDYMMKAKN